MTHLYYLYLTKSKQEIYILQFYASWKFIFIFFLNFWVEFFFRISILGSKDIFQEFCPFEGRFSLSYENAAKNDDEKCHELSNCLGSNKFQIKSGPCLDDPNAANNLEKVQIQTFQCLGDWPSSFPGKRIAIFKSDDGIYKCAVSILEKYNFLPSRYCM